MTIGRTPSRDPYDGSDPDDDEWLYLSNPAGLEAMWGKVQTLLGADGTVAGVVRGPTPDKWTAYASGPRSFRLTGSGHTPVAAMSDLSDELGSVRRLEDVLRPR